jgi:hypothetical protein
MQHLTCTKARPGTTPRQTNCRKIQQTTAAERLDEHVEEHRQGRAAVLTAVAQQAGLDFKVTRTWPGGHAKERQLKTRSGALYCPDCSPHPQPGTTPPQAGAEYLTRRQREARAREAQAGGGAKPERTPLWLLERTAVPVPPHECRPQCNCAEIEAAVSRILQDIGAEPRKEGDMFGRGARAAAREQVAQEARQQAEADALFAEADRWAEAAGEPAGFRQEITRERAARVMEQLAEPLTRDARAPAAAEPELAGADLDAEAGRLTELYPELEVPGEEPGPDAARWVPGPDGAEKPAPEGEVIRDWMADVPEDGREFLRGLLADAIEYRRAEAGDCADCSAEYGGLCYDHVAVEEKAGQYAGRLAQLDAGDRLAGATARLYEAPLPADGLPRLLDPAAEAPRAPEAWRLPDGTPHPDPVLAARGWQAQGGIYHRVPQAELEAG